jgi:hypothetical protein
MKWLLFCLLSACAFASTAKAHVLDQYLQVTQIALATEGLRIELRLIPGVEVADRLFALMDANGDGELSVAEQQAYAQRVWQDLTLSFDEQRIPLTLAETQFPERGALRTGLGAIKLAFTAAHPLTERIHFRNDHLPEFSVYLANALVPESDAIKINSQHRDAQQRELNLDIQAMPRQPRAWLWWAGATLLGLGWLALVIARRRGARVYLPSAALVLLMATMSAVTAWAHPEPVTLVMLDVAPAHVTMTLHVPLSELELAFGHEVSVNPETMMSRWQPAFTNYLLSHLRAVTQGQPWSVAFVAMHLETSSTSPSGPVQEAVVRLALSPPAGVTTRRFTLHYDVIMHQVVTHKALVSIRNDWERGQSEQEQVGVIQVDTGSGQIAPFDINLASGNWRAGFIGMLRHGMQHIREGTDHLLFLLVLLLPATLLAQGNRWGGFGGSRYALVRLFRIVTAFTLGHSLTLLIGALGWLRLPPQPVEVLIAFSILVSAAQALRPLFPGQEVYVAAGFGLVHGLAFATVLSDLRLSAGPMTLSILGFNLGIELMQLFVIAVTMPWLVLLSLTPLYRWVRIVCAVLAALAALGWMASRITGNENFIDRAMQTATAYAPLGLLVLMLLALPAYLFHATRREAAVRELID